MGRLFQFPLSRGCTPALYEEQPFWKTFFNSPYQEVVLWQYFLELAFLNTIFNSAYQAGVLWHYMRKRHFGVPFSIIPIKRLYSLAFIWGTGILGYLFQFPLSSRSTLWHYMGNSHFGIPFSIPLSRGCTLWHSYEEKAFWDAFFN